MIDHYSDTHGQHIAACVASRDEGQEKKMEFTKEMLDEAAAKAAEDAAMRAELYRCGKVQRLANGEYVAGGKRTKHERQAIRWALWEGEEES